MKVKIKCRIQDSKLYNSPNIRKDKKHGLILVPGPKLSPIQHEKRPLACRQVHLALPDFASQTVILRDAKPDLSNTRVKSPKNA